MSKAISAIVDDEVYIKKVDYHLRWEDVINAGIERIERENDLTDEDKRREWLKSRCLG